MYVAIRAQAAQASGELSYATKPTSIDGCSYNFDKSNSTSFASAVDDNASFQLHHMSYLYFSILGTITTVVVSFIVTVIDRDTTANVDLKLLAPFIRKYFNEKSHETEAIEVTKHTFEIEDNKLHVDCVAK